VELEKREKVKPGDRMYSMLKKYRRKRRAKSSKPKTNDLACVQNMNSPGSKSRNNLFGSTAEFSPNQGGVQGNFTF